MSTGPVPRWSGRSEALGAIFTWWNVLDGVMAAHSRIHWQTGYVRELQLRRMVQLVQAPGVSHYCEVSACVFACVSVCV